MTDWGQKRLASCIDLQQCRSDDSIEATIGKKLADIDHQISNRSLKGHKALLLQCYLYHLQRFF